MHEAKFLVRTRHKTLINEERYVVVDGVSYSYFLIEENISSLNYAVASSVRDEEESEISSSPVESNSFRDDSSQDGDASMAPSPKVLMLIETSDAAIGGREVVGELDVVCQKAYQSASRFQKDISTFDDLEATDADVLTNNVPNTPHAFNVENKDSCVIEEKGKEVNGPIIIRWIMAVKVDPSNTVFFWDLALTLGRRKKGKIE